MSAHLESVDSCIAPRSGEGDAHFRAILDLAVEGIIVVDERGVIETFNRAAGRMFGYKPAEVIGESVNMLMPEPFCDLHDGYIGEYLRTGRTTVIGIGRETVGRRKDGSCLPIELAVSEVPVGDRRTFAGIVRDITLRKRLEREILDVSEREQRMIGQALHDGVCQELAGIAFLVNSIQRRFGTNGTLNAADTALVTELLGKALRHARGLSQGLHPVDPQPGGLREALARLAANTADTFKIRCEFENDHAIEVHDAWVATNLYRIAQEAVRDAVLHGKARHIEIQLAVNPDAIILNVSDDGIGPTEDGRFRDDMVFAMMQHRARVIGAKLRIRPGSGELGAGEVGSGTGAQGNGVRVSCELEQYKPARKGIL